MTKRKKSVTGYLTIADLAKPFNFQQLCGNANPVELEIGAGRGDFLVGYAEEHPDRNVVAVERKLGYLARGINKAKAKDLQNVQFLNVEVRYFLQEYCPDGSLAAVHIYFPDPWPKKRHLGRRLIQPDFIEVLARKMVPGGELHLRTDHLNYFEQMMEVMGAQTFFVSIPTPENVSRHKTGFERRFAEQGIPGNYASYRLENPPVPEKIKE